jgi:hypothetical protein
LIMTRGGPSRKQVLAAEDSSERTRWARGLTDIDISQK